MIDTKTLDYLYSLDCEITPCGSRVTCTNPRPEADYDYLVFMPREVDGEFMATLTDNDYHWEGSQHYRDAANRFMSWRHADGNINLIVTRNVQFVADHKLATAVCKRLNLADKQDRIAVFQGLLYGNWEWKPTPPKNEIKISPEDEAPF